MIDVNKKMEKIEKNCLDTAKKELNQLKLENDSISGEKISEKVASYKKELSKKYENELNKFKREYNRNIFDYEMNEKKKVNNLKETLISNIEDKVKLEFKDFVNTEEYTAYLFNNIEEVLNKVKSGKCTIFVTENDYQKYSMDIERKYNVSVDKISNDNIGGCILMNMDNKISIDNTLKTNISEKIKKVSI